MKQSKNITDLTYKSNLSIKINWRIWHEGNNGYRIWKRVDINNYEEVKRDFDFGKNYNKWKYIFDLNDIKSRYEICSMKKW